MIPQPSPNFKPDFVIYTDGSGVGTCTPGAHAAVISGHTYEFFQVVAGVDYSSSVYRQELSAVLAGARAIWQWLQQQENKYLSVNVLVVIDNASVAGGIARVGDSLGSAYKRSDEAADLWHMFAFFEARMLIVPTLIKRDEGGILHGIADMLASELRAGAADYSALSPLLLSPVKSRLEFANYLANAPVKPKRKKQNNE